MDNVEGNLWEYNFARVIVVDVSDDYLLMQPPMPCDFYPILNEVWLPRFNLKESLARTCFMDGYLYDWHESPLHEAGSWYVGVVQEKLAQVAASA